MALSQIADLVTTNRVVLVMNWLASSARPTDSSTPMACPCSRSVTGATPEVVLRDCGADHLHMRRVLCELREAVLEQVGKDQTDRLRHALSDAVKALSA